MKRSSVTALVVAVAVIGGIGGFFGGMSYGKSNPSAQAAMSTLATLTADQRSQLGGGFPDGTPGDTAGAAVGARGGGFTSGSIVGKDGTTITLKLTDGSTKYVLYSASTTISMTDTGSESDLVTGKDVTVSGTTNSDGSITATRIQLGTLPGGPPNADGAALGSTTTAGAGASTSTSSP